MLHVVLYQPEIPPNTGNIIRLCANTGASLHLIRPLGFSMDDRLLRRAGLDYAEHARVRVHDSLPEFVVQVSPRRLVLFSTRGTRAYTDAIFQHGDALLFGSETRGLPEQLHASVETRLYIPMQPASRSLNLSNAVAIACYEAWRQLGFPGGRARGSTGSRSPEPGRD